MKKDNGRKVLITGGNGFIGSHLAIRLRESDYQVRVVDVSPVPSKKHDCEQNIGNLCDPAFCSKVVRGVDIVFHFAANMGGMGAIHATNEFTIYKENSLMTLCLLEAAISAGVQSFFYASSACVYPDALQSDASHVVSLRESDVAQPPASQGLYGLQKLHGEHVLDLFRDRIEVFVARFHNVYGPNGAWKNGREKVPAALLRKALAIQELQTLGPEEPLTRMEIWGDGNQRRSFLYIDDCIEAILALWRSPWHHALNIGSDSCIPIRDLGVAALKVTGEQEVDSGRFKFTNDRPVGVASRSSNNALAYEQLGGWRPSTTIEQGLSRMNPWMKGKLQEYLDGQSSRRDALQQLCSSAVLDMRSTLISYAILLPITSRGIGSSLLFRNLRKFARSLYNTTFKDTHNPGAIEQYKFQVYLAIDSVDSILNTSEELAEKILQEQNIGDVVRLVCDVEAGHVCEFWRIMAKRAYEDKHDYFVLMGDDIEIQDCDWMSGIHAEFLRFQETHHVPFGVGCIAFTDTTFPGMPTFPVVHRKHLDIFEQVVVPPSFVNQDGDPYLFQLYRRWGCSTMVEYRIKNSIGGSDNARYLKKPTIWTFDTLSNSVSILENWLAERGCKAQKRLALDVVVPSYRVDLTTLDQILALKPSSSCTVMFIIIVDDPTSAAAVALELKHAHRPDVRIRVNRENLGASASRNRGLAESAAEWVIFLDDDVRPDDDLLVQAELSIREHPEAAGFVGTTEFPPADSVFKASVHLAGVTYFWDIARKLKGPPATDVPWGVTANLIARRDFDDGVCFDSSFPKTGGGEDIAFCRNKRMKSIGRGTNYGGFYIAPKVKVTHPWWTNGDRSYWRFYMWSKGDGALIGMFPHLTYWDHAPNSAELLLLAVILLGVGSATLPILPSSGLYSVQLGGAMFMSVLIANIVHDWYRHLLRDRERARALDITIGGLSWLLAITESTAVRMASEGGRLMSILERGEVRYLGKRFDWFAFRCGDGPMKEERKNNLQRLALAIVIGALARQAF